MLHIFSQTALWQPVSPLYIKEDTQVHLFVPANSSETVTGLLQKHAITHEYVAYLKTQLCNQFFVIYFAFVVILGCYWPTLMS